MGKWSGERRRARARERGFASPYQLSKAGEAAAEASLADNPASLGRSRKARDQAARERAEAADAVVELGDGELVSSRLADVIRNATKRAATADRRLSAVVTVSIAPSDRNPAGGVRDVHLWQLDKSGDHRYSAENLLADFATHGGVKPAFLYHAANAMRRSKKYPDKPVAVLHIDLTASD